MVHAGEYLWFNEKPIDDTILECYVHLMHGYLLWCAKRSSDDLYFIEEMFKVATWLVQIIEHEEMYDNNKIPLELATLVVKMDGVVAPPDPSPLYREAFDLAEKITKQ
jgi:hypothetical protein